MRNEESFYLGISEERAANGIEQWGNISQEGNVIEARRALLEEVYHLWKWKRFGSMLSGFEPEKCSLCHKLQSGSRDPEGRHKGSQELGRPDHSACRTEEDDHMQPAVCGNIYYELPGKKPELLFP